MCINALVPILSHNLIYDNGASLKGKGVSFSARRTEKNLHSFYRRTGGNDGYVVCIDFTSYFNNILHQPLFDILDKYILDPHLNALEKSFIKAPEKYGLLSEPGKGLFIGPEDSQILAVSYPSSIDHKIKDQWGIKEYVRYNDDSYFLTETLEDARRCLSLLLAEYDRLGIIPNKKKNTDYQAQPGIFISKNQLLSYGLRKGDKEAGPQSYCKNT